MVWPMWRVRWRVLVWACVVVAGAVGVGRVVQVLSVEGDKTSANLGLPSKHKHGFNGTLAAQSDQLMWFMQISDLHLSIWQDQKRIEQFEQFCRHTVPTIAPHVVLASGDLTDAKTADGMGAKQYLEEWRRYRDILKRTGLYNDTLWLDVRGNHDNFNLPSLSSPANLYKTHSVQGPHHQRSYLYSARSRGVSVAFVAIDATPLPGPKRPFNFVGVLPPSEFSLLRRFAQEARDTHDVTVFFGHYPTSCIIGPEHGVHGMRGVMEDGAAYLCGHLHSLGGVLPAMYTRHQNGLLELELEDWKDGRMYRVLAVDHGLFSFVDVRHNTWPVILVTNPKHALFLGPSEDHANLSKYSLNVRVLVWSVGKLKSVAMKVDGVGRWTPLRHVEGPLYVAEWLPMLYTEGLHTLTVRAADVDGRERLIEQPFSFDGSRPSFRFLPRLFLMCNISAVFQLLFGCSVCVCVLILCLFKYLHYSVSRTGRRNICRGGIFRWRVVRAIVRKLWVLSSVDEIFWPLIIFILYLPVGPWLVGELLDGQYGLIFAWGTFVYSSFLPGSLSFAYGFGLVTFYFFPLILALAHCVDCRMQSLYVRPCRGPIHYTCKILPLLLPITMQVYLSYLMYLAYGWISLVFGPIRSWSAALGIVLWACAERLPARKLKRTAEMWFGDNAVVITPDYVEEPYHVDIATHSRHRDDFINETGYKTSVFGGSRPSDYCEESGHPVINSMASINENYEDVLIINAKNAQISCEIEKSIQNSQQ